MNDLSSMSATTSNSVSTGSPPPTFSCLPASMFQRVVPENKKKGRKRSWGEVETPIAKKERNSLHGTTSLRPVYEMTEGLLQMDQRIGETQNVQSNQDSTSAHYFGIKNPRDSVSSLTHEEALDVHDYCIHNQKELFNKRYEVCGKLIGKVVEGYDIVLRQKVAIKIIKKKNSFRIQAQTEIRLLEKLSSNCISNRSQAIVKLMDVFDHKGHQCLVFELLSHSLYDYLKLNRFQGLSLDRLQKISFQIIEGLEYLSQLQIIHCDLKPENILFVHPYQDNIRIIDFGSSCQSNEKIYQYIQSRFYRAPEVLLGLSYSSSIDMWSLGCLLVEMRTGEPLFSGGDQLDQMSKIIGIRGFPPQDMMCKVSSDNLRKYFDVETDHESSVECIKMKPIYKTEAFATLKNVLGIDDSPIDSEDSNEKQLHLFYDFVDRMLEYSPDRRMTPSEALLHPFLAQEAKNLVHKRNIPSFLSHESPVPSKASVGINTKSPKKFRQSLAFPRTPHFIQPRNPAFLDGQWPILESKPREATKQDSNIPFLTSTEK